MESLDWKTLLLFIKKSAPELLKAGIDEMLVRPLIESAEILADGLLAMKGAGKKLLSAGAQVAAALYEAACSVYRIIVQIIGNDSHEKIKNKYKKFSQFVEEMKLEIKLKVDAIQELIKEVKVQVRRVTKIENEELKDFIDDLSISVRMIDVDIQCCKRKVEFTLEKIKGLTESVADANDKDLMNTIIKGIAGGVASGVVGGVAGAVAAIALAPVLPIVAIAGGVAALGLGVSNYVGYQGRSEERDQFKSNLEHDKLHFENKLVDLENCETTLKALAKIAEEEREKRASHAQ